MGEVVEKQVEKYCGREGRPHRLKKKVHKSAHERFLVVMDDGRRVLKNTGVLKKTRCTKKKNQKDTGVGFQEQIGRAHVRTPVTCT